MDCLWRGYGGSESDYGPGVGSIALRGEKGSNYLIEHNINAGTENSYIINCRKENEANYCRYLRMKGKNY